MIRGRRAALRAPENRLTVLLTVTDGLGVLVGLVALAAVWNQPAPELWRIAAAAVLVALGGTPLVRLRFGADGSSFNYGEATVILLLALLPTSWLLVVALVASAVTQLTSRLPARKIAFNVAAFLVPLAVAAGVVAVLGPLPPHGVLGAHDVAELLAGMLAFSLLQNSAVAAAVSFSQQIPFGVVLRRSLGPNALIASVNALIGVSVLLLARWDLHTLLPLPAFVLTLLGTYRGYLMAAESRDTWRRLELAGKDFNQLEETALAEAVLEHAGVLFTADWVELVLDASGSHPARSYTREVSDPRTSLASPRQHGTERREHGVLIESGVGPTGSAATVSLTDGTEQLGVLRVGFRGSVSLSRTETQVLSNFARSVAAAVSNARLYAELQSESTYREFQATHDVLTGLPNRRLLLDAAAVAADALGPGESCALLTLSVDHFKETKDTLGHNAGDELLVRIAARIAEVVAGRGTVAHLGGEEFAVLLTSSVPLELPYVAAEIGHALAEPFSVDLVLISVEASIGAACLPEDCTEPAELLQRADVALSVARASGSSFRRYHPAEDGTSRERLELIAQLRSALARDEVKVFYQPQVDVAAGSVVGLEALVRWQHPDRGLLPPTEFISAVEQSGLVRPFTLHVIGEALAQAATWRRAGHEPTISVNLAARNLLDRHLPEDIDRLLGRYGFPAGQLVLEITETTVVSELEVVEEVLSGLHALGVELSVDDFGTGYSSLALLKRIAVDEIKVDRSFVAGMLDNPSNSAIVRATVELGHSLGLRVVAEGVENAELLGVLARMGCDRAQGYHLGRPGPAEAVDLPVWLDRPGPVRLAAVPDPAVRPVRRRDPGRAGG